MKLEVLIGMIGSGKSTYARKRAKEGALVVCHDALTAMLHAEYRYEQGLRDCYRQMEEHLVYAAIHHGRDAVIDRTHLTRESRDRWVRFAALHREEDEEFGEALAVTVIAVTFPIEAAVVHAIRRWESDPRGRPFDEWLKVAEHHAEQAEREPLDWRAEGFDGCVSYSGCNEEVGYHAGR